MTQITPCSAKSRRIIAFRQLSGGEKFADSESAADKDGRDNRSGKVTLADAMAGLLMYRGTVMRQRTAPVMPPI